MNKLPNVFIASSTEGISVAEAVNIKLEYDAKVKQWDNAFDLSSVTINSLIKRANNTDYGVFVFHKDDETTIRGETYSTVRDNVLFELGLFIGALGIEKCFVLIPKSKEGEFRLPTDLSGVTMTSYDDALDNMVDAVTTSCAKIKHAIKTLELDKKSPKIENESAIVILQKQLLDTQSNLWSLSHEAERSKEESRKLLESIKNHFFSVAKPATPAEIKAWETGAKDSYLKEVKIRQGNVYFIDNDIVMPPLHGASSMSVIVAAGVRVYGIDSWNHNSIYYMDGFRTDSRI
ncbi:MAG: nucleotide-binding protein [Sulfurimonas sp.]|uniref:nucleotide-binding protein n=1 Tax=Sulfurimonas sp. TaxID=2022749 RepID=UPI0028CC240D|nr:nucleotide-binding protein [Sulfurimonas sp.]MDT8339310.1 nucleotide-binding protein [Sulfurimonas sp.]